MTDIYVKPVIIDIETGDVIDNDSFDTKMVLILYKLGYISVSYTHLRAHET